MWWKNVKLNVLIAFVIIFLVWLLVGLGCGLPGISSRSLTKNQAGVNAFSYF